MFRTLIIVLALTGLFGLMPNFANAQDAPRRVVVEDVPTLKDVYRVSADRTHSGFAVPRYVSLKYGKVNGRQGPSTQHPILWQYRRKGLPLVVVAEMDIWRKVRDHNGDESWLRTQALSGVRMVMAIEDFSLYAKPGTHARTVALVSKNSLFKLIECGEDNWCRVRSDGGHKGWAQRRFLWGAEKL